MRGSAVFRRISFELGKDLDRTRRVRELGRRLKQRQSAVSKVSWGPRGPL